MNNKEHLGSPLACNSSQNFAHQLEAWVILGLLVYWHKNLPPGHSVYRLLSARIEGLFRYEWPDAEFHYETDAVAAWFATKHACLQVIDFQDTDSSSAEPPLPFIELARAYQLDETWLFILALLGFLETDHLMSQAIAELQESDKASGITVHVLCALVNHLLSDRLLTNTFFQVSTDTELDLDSARVDAVLTPVDIAEHSLVLQQVIHCHGDLIWSLQRIQTNKARSGQ